MSWFKTDAEKRQQIEMAQTKAESRLSELSRLIELVNGSQLPPGDKARLHRTIGYAGEGLRKASSPTDVESALKSFDSALPMLQDRVRLAVGGVASSESRPKHREARGEDEITWEATSDEQDIGKDKAAKSDQTSGVSSTHTEGMGSDDLPQEEIRILNEFGKDDEDDDEDEDEDVERRYQVTSTNPDKAPSAYAHSKEGTPPSKPLCIEEKLAMGGMCLGLALGAAGYGVGLRTQAGAGLGIAGVVVLGMVALGGLVTFLRGDQSATDNTENNPEDLASALKTLGLEG